MIDFISAVKNILEEHNENLSDLFSVGVISKNTFYKYKKRNPSLTTLIKVANFLKTTIDYLYELKDTNNFVEYAVKQTNFYNTLMAFIERHNISCRKFCKDLNYAKDNVLRWKTGTLPSVRTLYEISKYFGCEIDELLQKK